MDCEEVKTILISFASPDLCSSAERFHKQARESGLFDDVFVYGKEDVLDNVLSHFPGKFNPQARGWGYWCWKPLIVLDQMKRRAEGDIVIYLDVGCHINGKGRDLFNGYLELCKSDGGIFFQSQLSDAESNNIAFWKERDWTFPWLIDLFENDLDEMSVEDGQIVSTAFMLINNRVNRQLVEEWLSLYQTNYDFMTDKILGFLPSNFYQNRHDQSAFSLIVKKHSKRTLPLSQIELPDIVDFKTKDWSRLQLNPFQAKRDLKYTFPTRFRRFIGRLTRALKRRVVIGKRQGN